MGIFFHYGRLPLLSSSSVNFSTSGDNTVIASTTNKRILVQRLWFVASADVTIVFKRGSTALSGPIDMLANGALVFDLSGEPWFTTDLSEAFVVNTDAAVQISGMIYYNLGGLNT